METERVFARVHASCVCAVLLLCACNAAQRCIARRVGFLCVCVMSVRAFCKNGKLIISITSQTVSFFVVCDLQPVYIFAVCKLKAPVDHLPTVVCHIVCNI